MTNPGRYILDERGEPKPEPDLMTWGTWLQTADRTVGKTQVGIYRVSTVFLGLDHNFKESGPPVLWECMIFVGHHFSDVGCERCSGSREQAEALHRKGCKHAKTIRHSYFVTHPRRKRRRHIARQMARKPFERP